ncbi:TPA: prepilin-type N-terminal cleavage/methylation domain-containing protein [Streptococcus pneumoniae]|nr:prepilin-type N-terminal cleavage/methylation domain-containing protein [Streptococcus pneumoniae]
MKKMMTFLKKAKVKAFTLVEMLVVLLIISVLFSVLFLLFVPNLTKQKEAVNDKGKAAVVKVVESQAELYSLEKNEDASLSKLQDDGRITEEQAKAYNEYYTKNGGANRKVND